MRKIQDFLARPKTKYVAITLAILVLFGLAFAFQPIKVRVGERLKCKYGETIEDNTKLVTLPRILSPFYGVKTSKTTCAKHRTCERLYKDASRLIAQGDIKGAGLALNSIKKRDPEFKNVEKKISKVNKELVAAGQQPITGDSGGETGDGSTSSGGETGDESTSDGQNDDGSKPSGNRGETTSYTYLLDLIPDKISGYTLWNEDFTELSAGRVFKPKDTSKIQLLTLAVELAGNTEGANAYIDKNVKAHYSANKDNNVNVDGIKCYFGTSLNRFAILAWQKSGIVYQVEMTTSSSPEKLKDDVIAIAKMIG